MKTYCGRCHTCGAKMRQVLDGEEWCDTCHCYRRYRSHGWAYYSADKPRLAECPQPQAAPTADPK